MQRKRSRFWYERVLRSSHICPSVQAGRSAAVYLSLGRLAISPLQDIPLHQELISPAEDDSDNVNGFLILS